MNRRLTLCLDWLDQRMLGLQAVHIWTLFGLLALFFASIGTAGFNVLARAAVDKEHARLDSIAALEVQEIDSWFAEQFTDMATLAGNGVFRELLTPIRLQHSGRWSDRLRVSSDAQRVTGWLNQAMLSHAYRSVEVVGASGQAIVSTGEPPYGRAEMLPLIRQVLVRSAPTLRDVQISADGQPCILFVSKVPDVAGLEPVALVFAINIADRLLPLLERWPNVSRTGDLLLYRHEPGRIALINKERGRQRVRSSPSQTATLRRRQCRPWQAAMASTSAPTTGGRRSRRPSDVPTPCPGTYRCASVPMS